MSKTLRIVHLEDNPTDADRVKAELTRAGVKTLSERVSTADGFTAALREFQPDVVLCDHAHASFDARTALAAARAGSQETRSASTAPASPSSSRRTDRWHWDSSAQ